MKRIVFFIFLSLISVACARIIVVSGGMKGILEWVDKDYQSGNANGVWGDGTFVYIANGPDGLHTYSVDGAGLLTHIDKDDQGGSAKGVWGDGMFIYLANDTDGILSYRVR